jgi:hypothetical protein
VFNVGIVKAPTNTIIAINLILIIKVRNKWLEDIFVTHYYSSSIAATRITNIEVVELRIWKQSKTHSGVFSSTSGSTVNSANGIMKWYDAMLRNAKHNI